MALPDPSLERLNLGKVFIVGRVLGTARIAPVAVDDDGVLMVQGKTTEDHEFKLMRRELERMSALLERLVELKEAQSGVV